MWFASNFGLPELNEKFRRKKNFKKLFKALAPNVPSNRVRPILLAPKVPSDRARPIFLAPKVPSNRVRAKFLAPKVTSDL